MREQIGFKIVLTDKEIEQLVSGQGVQLEFGDNGIVRIERERDSINNKRRDDELREPLNPDDYREPTVRVNPVEVEDMSTSILETTLDTMEDVANKANRDMQNGFTVDEDMENVIKQNVEDGVAEKRDPSVDLDDFDKKAEKLIKKSREDNVMDYDEDDFAGIEAEVSESIGSVDVNVNIEPTVKNIIEKNAKEIAESMRNNLTNRMGM